MTKNESRERCLQNALAMLALFNLEEPKRAAQLSIGSYSIDLILYFDKEEKELMDKIVDKLNCVILQCTGYTEDYYKKNEFYVARYKWEFVD